MYIGGADAGGLLLMVALLVDDLLQCPKSRISGVQLIVENEDVISLRLTGEVGEFPQLNNVSDNSPAISLLTVVAMSEWVTFEYNQDGGGWKQEFLCRVGADRTPSERNGSPHLRVRFAPDRTLFPHSARLTLLNTSRPFQERALFHPTTTFSVEEARWGLRRDYAYPRGLYDYLDEICPSRTGDSPVRSMQADAGDFHAHALFKSVTAGLDDVHLFANGSRIYGGTPLEGLLRGLAKVRRERSAFEQTDYWLVDNVVVILSVQLPPSAWESPSRDVVGNSSLGDLVCRMVVEQWPAAI